MMKWIKRVFAFNPPWLVDQVVSLTLGSVIGTIIGIQVGKYYAKVLATPPPLVSNIWTNDRGQALPMRTFLPLLRTHSNYNISFEPSDLEQVIVCEFSRQTGTSALALFLEYINRYSMCFSLNQLSESTYVVRPNRSSGFLEQKSDGWFCKCG